jgi:hypothetical protein
MLIAALQSAPRFQTMKTARYAMFSRIPLPSLAARFRMRPPTLAGDNRGSMLVWLALGMPMVFGFAGLGLDVSSWYMDRRIMQSEVDAAAVDVAHAVMSGVTEASALRQVAMTSFARNNFDPGTQLEVRHPPLNGPNAQNALAVEVSLIRNGILTFSSLFVDDSGIAIRARAVGGVVGTGNRVCVLALDETMDRALEFSGNADASFNCGVASNSHSNSAIYIGGKAHLTADPAQAYGDITIQGAAKFTSSKPAQSNAPRIPDPYGAQGRNLQVPPASACTPAPTINENGSFTIYPGTYCGTIQVKKGTVTFAPGTYVIDSGDLNFQTHANVFGDGVTFILTGTNPANTGVIDFTSGADIKLTAPSSGPYAGVLVFEDRNAPSQQGGTQISHSILGGALQELNGAIYLPRREIRLSGGSASAGQCMQVIARKVTVTGNGTIENDQMVCEALGMEDMQQVRVRLIE